MLNFRLDKKFFEQKNNIQTTQSHFKNKLKKMSNEKIQNQMIKKKKVKQNNVNLY